MENVRGLRDQDVAVLEEGRGKRRMLSARSVHQKLHRRHAAAVARDIDVFGAGLLQGEAHEFAAPLNRRPVIELICHADPPAEPVP